MAYRNYTQKVRTATGYDFLYPKTTAEQVILSNPNFPDCKTADEAFTSLNVEVSELKTVKTAGDQTISGTKTFIISPSVPNKTAAATNSSTAIATEAQVYVKANSGTPIKTALPVSSGYTVGDTRYSKNPFNWCLLEGTVYKTSSDIGSSEVVATLPTGNRPQYTYEDKIALFGSSGWHDGKVTISTNGQIKIEPITTGLSLQYIYFHILFSTT